MKFLVVLAVAVACAAADVSHIVPSDEAHAPIVRSDYQLSPETNSYQWSYETGNGISAQAEGSLKNANSDAPVHQVRGGYQYTAPDGTPIDLQYFSDENGFQVRGSHVPVPPPIPEPIARALAYIAAHPPAVAPSEGVFTKP